MISPSVGQLADNVTEVVGEVLTTGMELAGDAAKHLPEVTESVGKIARSSAEVVADLAATAIALTPFVRSSSSRRGRRWWVVPAVVVALVAVLAVVKRSRSCATSAPSDVGGSTGNNADLDDRPLSAVSA